MQQIIPLNYDFWRIDAKTGFITVTACIIKSGVYYYEKQGNLYLSPGEIIKSLDNLSKATITINHNWITASNSKEYICGYILGDTIKQKIIKDELSIWADLQITDKDVIELMISKTPSQTNILLSAGYRNNIVYKKGIINDQEYDGLQTDLQYNHIALINSDDGSENRMGEIVRLYNSKEVSMADDMQKDDMQKDDMQQDKVENSADQENDEKQKSENAIDMSVLEKYMKQMSDINANMMQYMQSMDQRVGKIENMCTDTQDKMVKLENAKEQEAMQKEKKEAAILLNSLGVNNIDFNQTVESLKLQAINLIRKSQNKELLNTDNKQNIDFAFDMVKDAIESNQKVEKTTRTYNSKDCDVVQMNTGIKSLSNAELNKGTAKGIMESITKYQKNLRF